MTASDFNGLPVETDDDAFGDPWVFEPFGHDQRTVTHALPRMVAAARLVEPLGIASRPSSPCPKESRPPRSLT